MHLSSDEQSASVLQLELPQAGVSAFAPSASKKSGPQTRRMIFLSHVQLPTGVYSMLAAGSCNEDFEKALAVF